MKVEIEPMSVVQAGWRRDWRRPFRDNNGVSGYRLSCSTDADANAVVEIQCHLQPDNSGVVILPSVVDGTLDLRAAFPQLLVEASGVLRDSLQASSVRCIMAQGHTLAPELERAGFEFAESLTHWQMTKAGRSTERPVSADWEITTLPIDGIDFGERRSDVASLLDSILAAGEDVTSMTVPSASGLLRLWELLAAPTTVTLAWQADVLAGITVLTATPFDSSATLEYIGVHPEHRRCGLGTALLDAALQTHPRKPDGAVVATAASANRAVGRLYANAGFRPCETLSLWWAAWANADGRV